VTRIVRRRISIESWRGEDPETFRDGDVLRQVEDWIDAWREMGNWWEGEGPRRIVRVVTVDGQVFDLECADDEWWIYKVWD
jgi:hypothetical protein